MHLNLIGLKSFETNFLFSILFIHSNGLVFCWLAGFHPSVRSHHFFWYLLRHSPFRGIAEEHSVNHFSSFPSPHSWITQFFASLHLPASLSLPKGLVIAARQPTIQPAACRQKLSPYNSSRLSLVHLLLHFYPVTGNKLAEMRRRGARDDKSFNIDVLMNAPPLSSSFSPLVPLLSFLVSSFLVGLGYH